MQKLRRRNWADGLRTEAQENAAERIAALYELLHRQGHAFDTDDKAARLAAMRDLMWGLAKWVTGTYGTEDTRLSLPFKYVYAMMCDVIADRTWMQREDIYLRSEVVGAVRYLVWCGLHKSREPPRRDPGLAHVYRQVQTTFGGFPTGLDKTTGQWRGQLSARVIEDWHEKANNPEHDGDKAVAGISKFIAERFIREHQAWLVALMEAGNQDAVRCEWEAQALDRLKRFATDRVPLYQLLMPR